MAQMWVQLRVAKTLEVAGRTKHFKPGDWVKVGKQTALRWQASGEIYIHDGSDMGPIKGRVGSDCGILARGDEATAKEVLENVMGSVAIDFSAFPDLRWAKTLFWTTGCTLRLPLLPIAYNLLDTWQVAVPLCKYSTLAKDIGPEEERQRTVKVVRDLRVPLYDTRMMFFRRCGDTERLIEIWMEERFDSFDERLSFLRALYRVKPLVLALPVSWTGDMGPMGD